MTRREFIKNLLLIGSGAITIPLYNIVRALPVELTKHSFGRNFVWGTSTSALQIEGAINEDGRGPSIWDNFKKVKTKETPAIACDFYHKYPEDIKLLNELNFDAFRFSVAWTRILPHGKGEINQKGIDFYNKVIDTCLQYNIKPYLTCFHWDLPQALQDIGGWTNRDTYKYFLDYVEILAKNYGDRVKNWFVLNEPLAFTALGYLIGIHAPGKRSINKFIKAVLYTALAQGEGGRVLQIHLPKDANIGTTLSVSPIHPYKQTLANKKAVLKADAFYNRLFLEPALGLGFPVKELPWLKRVYKLMQPGDEDKLSFDFHTIGIQYYKRVVVKPGNFIPIVKARIVRDSKIKDAKLTAMGWEIYPKGIYEILKQFAQYQKIKNILITENGIALEDKLVNGKVRDTSRIQYIKDHLYYVLKAKQEGVPVSGYFYWSLMDNFEWNEGFRPRYGLIYIDYKTQKRYLINSALSFQKFLQS